MNHPNDQPSKNDPRRQTAIGMGGGVTLGIVLGVAMGNIALGLAIGIIVGGLGVTINRWFKGTSRRL